MINTNLSLIQYFWEIYRIEYNFNAALLLDGHSVNGYNQQYVTHFIYLAVKWINTKTSSELLV